MKDEKKILTVIISLLVLLAIVIIAIISILKNNNTEGNDTDEDEIFEGDSYIEEAQKVDDENIYYAVEKCVQKYYSNESSEYTAIKMNYITGATYSTYAVEGLLITNGSNKRVFNKVNVDTANTTYEVLNVNRNEDTEIDDIDLNIDNLEPIEPTDDNAFEVDIIGYDGLIKKYISYYLKMAVNYPAIAYELTDEEYRSAKFANVDEFKQYINKNKNELQNLKVYQYQINEYDEYREFIVRWTDMSYSIIKEKSIMDFTIMLDTYTVDTAEFKEKYNNSTDQQKVGMNIDKIISAINNNDYKYVYSKLDDTFKKNNYPTLSSLQTYIENNLFDANNIEYLSCSQEGDIFIYKTKITEKGKEFPEEKNVNFIMQLGDETEFVMSFNMQ